MAREGTLFVLVGPSGAGKNTLMRRVQRQFGDLPQLATMTTRPQRPTEREGREHWFVSREEFEDLIANKALIEYQKVHMDQYYGTPRKTIEEALAAKRDLIADIDFLGAAAIRNAYPDHTVIIFVTPSRLDILAARIQLRGGITSQELANRLERARFELTFAPQSDYLVVNDDREQATTDLYQIIGSERQQRGEADYGVATVARHVFQAQVMGLVTRGELVLVRAGEGDGKLPVFAHDDLTQMPHETLRAQLEHELAMPVEIEALADKRFDFTAPRYVTLAADPPEFTWQFYYRCFLPAGKIHPLDGWIWEPANALDLPLEVREHVLS